MFLLKQFVFVFLFSIKLSFSKECGKIGEYMTRIVGGSKPDYMQYPWLARLYIQFSNSAFSCGATLIDDQYLVSAAHCFESDQEKGQLKRIIVYLGDFDSRKNDQSELQLNAWAYQHKDYDSRILKNDIALLRLERALNTEEQKLFIPICLPEKNTKIDNDNCDVSGWGKRGDAEQESSQFLYHIRLPFHPEACKGSHHICAGNTDGQGTCNGDSGGPLQCPRLSDKRMVLQGITSAGDARGCQTKGVYDYFTNTRNYLDWIRLVKDHWNNQSSIIHKVTRW